MCSRFFHRPEQESMKSLLTLCVEYLLSHIDAYSNNLPFLPVHVKNRILKRLTTVKVNNPNITDIYRMLVHSQLKRIDFSLNELDDNMINILVDCRDIQELILTRNENNILTEKALLNVMPNFNKLLILQVQNCVAITDNVIKATVENCPNLSEIDIAGCNISDSTLTELSKLTNLKALNISRTKITNSGIKFLVQGPSASLINELRIADCDNVTHVAINLICETCKSLEVFIFNNCVNANDQTQVNFETNNFSKLKQLTWTVYW